MSYARIKLSLVVSENEDFSQPFIVARPEPGSSALTPLEAIGQRVVATTGGTQIRAEYLGLAEYLVVWNDDYTNFVTVSYTNLQDDPAFHTVGPRKFCVLSDVNASGSNNIQISADTADCNVHVYGIGASA
jgi:hypothetical protein